MANVIGSALRSLKPVKVSEVAGTASIELLMIEFSPVFTINFSVSLSSVFWNLLPCILNVVAPYKCYDAKGGELRSCSRPCLD